MRHLRALAPLPILALATACAPDAPTEPAAPLPIEASLSRAGSGADLGLSAEDRKLLAEVRHATARFQDVEAAEAAGYISTHECVAHPELGGMGIHFVHPGLAGLTEPVDGRANGTDPEIDPLRPELLLYEPQQDGSLRLIAIEYLVFAEAWHQENAAAPTFLGRTFDYMEDDPGTPFDEAHAFMPHYDQHVWVWDDNPSGLLEPWNPDVACPEGGEHH